MLIQGAGVKSALAVFLFTSLVAERGEAYVYYCTLKEVVNLTSKGTIGPDFMKDLALQYPLVVDTETGKVLHPIFGNTSYDHLTVNPATKISAFQVIAEDARARRLLEAHGLPRLSLFHPGAGEKDAGAA